ncbi:MAG TPA: O-antigen ligase family protein [Opitutaceae bacterium]
MSEGGSARTSSDRSLTERLAFFHLVFLLIFSSWALGGNINWAERDICWIGSAGIIITGFEGYRRFRSGRGSMRPFWILLPWALFNGLVMLSTTHPSFRLVHVEGADVLLPTDVNTMLPSTARPAITWSALWMFDALFLPAFNVLLAFRSRQLVRVLLLLFSGNAVLLAIFGTLQKLSHAGGIYFGRIHSPNTKFFSTFIYDNHWGSFAVLAIAAGLGLIFRRSHFASTREFLNSPAFGGSLAILLLAASVPLSSSRSCTALVLTLLGVALLHALRRIVTSQRERSESSYRPLLAIFFVSTVTFVAIYALAKPVILKRVEETREQIETFERTHSLGTRPTLYRDTWQMASDRALFGWGLGSYGTVFARYNTQVAVDRLPQYYQDAHSDWLQALAETGWIGGALRALMVVLPGVTLFRSRPWRSCTAYPLFGCALILVYAWVEFPFGNVAVSLAWWACWFSAVRLAQLDAREAHP